MSEIIQINETTWRIEDDGVRFFLLTGTERALMIDSGMRTTDAKTIAESITTLPIQLLNTHADPDHMAGNGMFASVWMHSQEEVNYHQHGGVGEILPVAHGDQIDLGDRVLEIIHLPGHTPGSIAILDRKYRVLISGDSVQDSRIFMFGKHRDMATYITSLEMLSQYEGQFDTIYPSHGTFPVAPQLISKLIDGAKQILAGQAKGTEIPMFGRSVMLYQFDFAGFLCELPQD